MGDQEDRETELGRIRGTEIGGRGGSGRQRDEAVKDQGDGVRVDQRDRETGLGGIRETEMLGMIRVTGRRSYGGSGRQRDRAMED